MRGLRYKLNTYVENEGCNERTNSINKINKKQERREKTSLAMNSGSREWKRYKTNLTTEGVYVYRIAD